MFSVCIECVAEGADVYLLDVAKPAVNLQLPHDYFRIALALIALEKLPPNVHPAQGKGCIIAFDKDATRLERLRDTAKRAGAADIIDARCQDMLSMDPTGPEYAEVRASV
jgi:hypothetical protein